MTRVALVLAFLSIISVALAPTQSVHHESSNPGNTVRAKPASGHDPASEGTDAAIAQPPLDEVPDSETALESLQEQDPEVYAHLREMLDRLNRFESPVGTSFHLSDAGVEIDQEQSPNPGIHTHIRDLLDRLNSEAFPVGTHFRLGDGGEEAAANSLSVVVHRDDHLIVLHKTDGTRRMLVLARNAEGNYEFEEEILLPAGGESGATDTAREPAAAGTRQDDPERAGDPTTEDNVETDFDAMQTSAVPSDTPHEENPLTDVDCV